MGDRGLESPGRCSSRSRWRVGVALGAVVLVAAACSSGSSASSTTQGKSSTAATSGPATVVLARAGSLGTVLVNTSGMTLYHFTPDSVGKSVCTGGCATIWPPLTVPAGTKPVAGTGLASAQVGTITRDDGTTQVTFRGMPLYTFSGDKMVGQANGQNVAGEWFVLTATSSASPSGGGGTTTTTKASGGYGY
jgi:predicted lipoprotein with Yx(FWY)xxD motif